METRWSALAVVLTFTAITGVFAQEPRLLIKPDADVQKHREVGKTLVLTCFAEAADTSLVTNFEWLDIHNRTVRPKTPHSNSRFSIDYIQTSKELALIINPLEKEDEGTYTCKAMYAGTTPLYKTVKILTIVGITWKDAPEEQHPLAGQDYKVKCKVWAEPGPRVDWMINEKKLIATGRYIEEPDGLIIQKVQETDDGIYTCRAVVIETGELRLKNIKVEVHTPPTIKEGMPKTLEVVDGESASITCAATGKPQPTYSWIRGQNQKNLASASDRFSVNEITGVLSISRVTQDDNGDFKCVATNNAGSKEKNVRLVVVIKPHVMDIKNISVPTEKEAQLVCRATGNPLPVITFRKLSSPREMISGIQSEDDRIIFESKEDKEKGESIGTLIINPVQTRDDGLYACIARNKGGEMIKNGHLQVEFKPSFANSPMKEAWSWAKRPINLTCIAESIPNATITWRLNDRDIEKDPNFRKFGNGPQSSILVTPSDSRFYGIYKCVGRNIHGETYHSISLNEARIPSEILQTTFDVITATTITFSFIGPSDTGGRPIKAYAVEYKKERENWNMARNKTWATDSSYILEGLEPQTGYNLRFAALNEVGLGPWSAARQQTMPKRSNPEEPLILNQPVPEGFVASAYADRFELRWKKPADNGEYIDKYQIEYCTIVKVDDKWEDTEAGCRTLDLKNSEQTSIDIMELTPDSYYKVELRAHNAIGFSTPGQIILKTARDVNKLDVFPGDQWSSTSTSSVSSFDVVCLLLWALTLFYFKM